MRANLTVAAVLVFVSADAATAERDRELCPTRGNPVSGVLRFDGVKLASDVSVNVEIEYAIDASDPPDSLRVFMVGRSSD